MKRISMLVCGAIGALAFAAAQAQISLNGARIGAEDVAALAEFYQEAFGLKEVNRLEFPGMLEIMLDFGDTVEAAKANPAADVVIMPRESDDLDDPVPHLIFNVTDAAAVAAAVEAAGGRMDGPPRAFGNTGIVIAFGRDPAGNRFELIQGLGGTDASAARGSLERITVHGTSLEGNLAGDDPNREVFVYLPPSYASRPERRYPVVYFLHGYSVGADTYADLLGLPEAVDGAIANGAREMIVVLPDANTLYNGSMYSSSATTGDWEGFVAKDLVEHIDQHYRTIPSPESRGLSGHSMGGYGTLRIGMKHPGVFGALFAMSSCCLMNAAPSQEAVEAQIERTKDGPPAGGGFANALLAQAAAWAPNPQNPPLYFDWPYKDGAPQPLVQAKWTANSPLVLVDQFVPSLRSYRAISIDVGDADGLRASNEQLSEALDRLGVEHAFEVYEGDHVNRVAQRFRENVLPFFSEHLE